MRDLARWVLLCAVLVSGAGRAQDLTSASDEVGRSLAQAFLKSPDRAGITTVSAPAFSEASAAGLGAQVSALVGKRLAADARINVVDSAKLQAIAAEAKLQAASGKDPDAILAQRAGAQAMLLGSVAGTSDKLVLQARLVLVSNGKVIASGRAEAAAPKRAAGAVESQSIEVAMRRLSDGLAEGFSRLPGSARYRRLAVLPFTEVGEEAKKRQVGLIVAAEVATDLRRDHNLLLVERQKLVDVMGELRLQQSGAVDPSQAGEIGKLADAQALVIGSASHLGDRYLVNARVVATETGETLAAESASVTAAGMVALASDAVVLRSRKDAVFRSLLIPGWGQIYNRESVKGFAVMGAEAALFGGALAAHLAGQSAYNDYTSKTSAGQLGGDPTGEAQALYDKAVSRYQLRNTLLIAGGALWVLNLVDAYFSGVDGDALLSSGVAEAEPPASGRRLAVSTDGRSVYAALRF